MDYKPIKLHPCYKEYMWGGEALKKKYNKIDAPDITAESWELAVHKDGCSYVDNGEHKGNSLKNIFMSDRINYLGTKCQSYKLPILVKMIDAKRDLSVQVHPSDENADELRGEEGKTEMWYVADCEPHASIYYGFKKQISKEEFIEKAKNGSICETLNSVPLYRGDVFIIKPGTIHAIRKGAIIIEIQQNSNTTFRVFDYQRQDSNGNYRELHLDRAAEVVDLNPVIPTECKANCEIQTEEFLISEMYSCQFFCSFRIDVKKEVSLSCDGTTFHHLLCVEGNGLIETTRGKWKIKKGDSYFMPANIGKYAIKNECRLILSKL